MKNTGSRLTKTRSKKIKRIYQLSLNYAEAKLLSHSLSPLTKENEQTPWWQWAQQMSDLFIRATSAVEGRNGWLSQIHFNGRGLPEKRIYSQTAIHNYYLQRSDSTTACERLSGIKPDDLLAYLLTHVTPLSQPRKRKKRNVAKPMILQAVPP